ncbi:12393_t:CDS:2 [Rhizophagus irregularis]|nr:12393_t:CDS:2 [Rhizophagus irregularis]
MDGRENSSSKLIGQIAAFRNNLPPYNDEFIPKYYTVEHWWNYVEQDEGEENFIQQLALKVFSITPHNAGCERIFSVMGWELVELLKLQEPQVIIEPVNSDHIIDHGNKNFDIEELLDQQFNDDDNV